MEAAVAAATVPVGPLPVAAIDARVRAYLASLTPATAVAAVGCLAPAGVAAAPSGSPSGAPPTRPPPAVPSTPDAVLAALCPPDVEVPASALAHLPPAVAVALRAVFASRVCHPSQFDDRAMDLLVALRPERAVADRKSVV